MENEITNKPTRGAWDNMSNEEKKEAIKFEFDKPQVVIMACDDPREIDWEDGVFYIFDVMQDAEEKVIKTSAWSLLKGLREARPFKDKVLKITKKMDKGKQQYFVEEVKKD